MDSFYEYAGASAASMLHDVLSDLGLPLIIAAAGLAWRFFRVAEDGIARPLATQLLSLMVLVWLLRPVTIVEGVRTPRFVQILGACADAFVKTSIKKINADFLTRPFEYERVAALAGQAHVQDPEVRRSLTRFLSVCTQNALSTGLVSARALENPIAPDAKLPYGGISIKGETCEAARARLWEDLQRELDRFALHQDALKAVGPEGRIPYLDAVVQNEWSGRVPDRGEMDLVRRSVGSLEAALAGDGADPKSKTFLDWFTGPFEALVTVATTAYAKGGQAVSDSITSKQRYFLVMAHAPYLYGLVLMMLTAFFPIVGLWALLPDRWTALVNYGKVFLSVKLWPIGWALISSFNAHRPPKDALTGSAASGDAFVASTLLYFMIPAFCFMIMHLATTAAAVPFREATPSVVGASNGPVGAVAMTVVRRVT